jgi:hypothetical protein
MQCSVIQSAFAEYDLTRLILASYFLCVYHVCKVPGDKEASLMYLHHTCLRGRPPFRFSVCQPRFQKRHILLLLLGLHSDSESPSQRLHRLTSRVEALAYLAFLIATAQFTYLPAYCFPSNLILGLPRIPIYRLCHHATREQHPDSTGTLHHTQCSNYEVPQCEGWWAPSECIRKWLGRFCFLEGVYSS